MIEKIKGIYITFLRFFFKKKLKKQLELIKVRKEIIDALLIARNNNDRVKEIKKQFRIPDTKFEEEFGFNEIQARAIGEIKKNLNEISEKSINEEKTNLIRQYKKVAKILQVDQEI